MGTTGKNLRKIGRFGKPHGIRGEINLIPVSPDTDRLTGLRTLYVGQDSESAKPFGVLSSRSHQSKKGPTVLVLMDGMSDRDAVGVFRGQRVFATDEDLPDLEQSEFYYSDIIGFEAFSDAGVLLGTVADILDRPPQDLVVIQTIGGEEAFVPLVREFVREVDSDMKRIIVAIIDGLM
jgi:16S rRNA processing protein RimM